jgi:hypothetical protein
LIQLNSSLQMAKVELIPGGIKLEHPSNIEFATSITVGSTPMWAGGVTVIKLFGSEPLFGLPRPTPDSQKAGDCPGLLRNPWGPGLATLG